MDKWTVKVVADDAKASGDQLKLMTDSLIARQTSMRDDVQVWAITAGLHAAMHGDITHIQRACEKDGEGLGEGFKLNALRMFFVDKSLGMPLDWVLKDKITKDPAHFVFNRAKADKLKERYLADPEAVLALLAKKPWYKFAKEQALFEGMDLDAKLATLLKQATAVLADAEKANHPANNLRKLDALRELVAGGRAAAAIAGQQLN